MSRLPPGEFCQGKKQNGTESDNGRARSDDRERGTNQSNGKTRITNGINGSYNRDLGGQHHVPDLVLGGGKTLPKFYLRGLDKVFLGKME